MSLRESLAAEALRAYPRECCGLIEGAARDDAIEALALHPARNLAKGYDRFEIDPADQFRLMRALRGSRRAIVGCYHSHPGGVAEPSAHDRTGAGEENFIWLIAGLRPGDAPSLAAFVFSAGEFRPMRLVPSLDRQARGPL
ncbi:MAG: M67 family metallopeptidase [Rhizomicrobium sp.]